MNAFLRNPSTLVNIFSFYLYYFVRSSVVEFAFNDKRVVARMTEEATNPNTNQLINPSIERYFTLKDNQNVPLLRVAFTRLPLLIASLSRYNILDLVSPFYSLHRYPLVL